MEANKKVSTGRMFKKKLPSSHHVHKLSDMEVYEVMRDAAKALSHNPCFIVRPKRD